MEFSIAVYLQNNYKYIYYKCNIHFKKQKLKTLPGNFPENRGCFTTYWHKIILFNLYILYSIK